MQLRAAERIYGLLHEDAPFHDGTFTNWASKPSREFPFHFNDGVSIWLSTQDDRPDDLFLGKTQSESFESDNDLPSDTSDASP